MDSNAAGNGRTQFHHRRYWDVNEFRRSHRLRWQLASTPLVYQKVRIVAKIVPMTQCAIFQHLAGQVNEKAKLKYVYRFCPVVILNCQYWCSLDVISNVKMHKLLISCEEYAPRLVAIITVSNRTIDFFKLRKI